MSLYGWAISLVVFVALAALLSSPPRYVRRGGRRLLALAVRAGDRLRPPALVDERADDLRRMIQRDRLRSDVERVRHLVGTDAWMPATRQMGNRIALGWLLAELERTQESGAVVPDGAALRWSLGRPCPPQDVSVEILDSGWRH